MGIRRLNHAVLYVRDVRRSVEFYRDLLGFRVVHELPGAAFLRAADSDNDHDLGLFQTSSQESGDAHASVGLYHLAWSVGTLAELAEFRSALSVAGALHGTSDHGVSKSLYAKDPDGLEFEVSWFVPRDRVTDDLAANPVVRRLNLDAEIAHWGTNLLGAP